MCRTGNVFGEQRSCRRRKAFEVRCIDMRLRRIRCSQLRRGGGVDGRQTGDDLDIGDPQMMMTMMIVNDLTFEGFARVDDCSPPLIIISHDLL